MSAENAPAVECATCGREGGPFDGCSVCFGRGGTQPAAVSLSQLRSNPNLQVERYGPRGEVGPKSIRLPGSQNN